MKRFSQISTEQILTSSVYNRQIKCPILVLVMLLSLFLLVLGVFLQNSYTILACKNSLNCQLLDQIF